jgi:hypothetical protein
MTNRSQRREQAKKNGTLWRDAKVKEVHKRLVAWYRTEALAGRHHGMTLDMAKSVFGDWDPKPLALYTVNPLRFKSL